MSTERNIHGSYMRRASLAAFICLAVFLALGSAGPALAQGNGKGTPEGTDKSMAITLDQIQNSVEKYRTERDGIVVHFVLPKGWELIEQGINPETGEEIKELGVYALLARRPMQGNTPTDFIFELDIYERRLMEDLPDDVPEDERNEDAQFWGFISAQMGMNARAGMKLTSEIRDVNFKEYRKGMAWVPIYYVSQSTGSNLITFSTVVDRKLVVLKFLISKDAMELHSGLVAFIINNSWVITSEKMREIESEAGVKAPTQ